MSNRFQHNNIGSKYSTSSAKFEKKQKKKKKGRKLFVFQADLPIMVTNAKLHDLGFLGLLLCIYTLLRFLIQL